MKPVKSLALIYLADIFINKIKTKFNRFLQKVSNTKRTHNSFEEVSPQWLNKIGLQKFYLSARKLDGCSLICAENCNRW